MSDKAEHPDKVSAELLPCRCCGYRAAIEQVPHDPESASSGGYYIECKRAGCGITTRLAFACKDDPLPGLIEFWNRRPSVAPSAGEYHALLQSLEERTAMLEEALNNVDEALSFVDRLGAIALEWCDAEIAGPSRSKEVWQARAALLRRQLEKNA